MGFPTVRGGVRYLLCVAAVPDAEHAGEVAPNPYALTCGDLARQSAARRHAAGDQGAGGADAGARAQSTSRGAGLSASRAVGDAGLAAVHTIRLLSNIRSGILKLECVLYNLS